MMVIIVVIVLGIHLIACASATTNLVKDDYSWIDDNNGYAASDSRETFQVHSTLKFTEYSSPTASASETPSKKTNTLPIIMGIVCAFVIACAIGAGFIYMKRVKARKNEEGENEQICCLHMSPARQNEEATLSTHIPESLTRYNYAVLSAATKKFSKNEILGKGGYGNVYKGTLASDGTLVAVKVMSAEGVNQFEAELSVIGRLKHKNLVGLKGWCHHQDKLILVYDYMPNGSLDHHLFPAESLLSWSQRYEIVKGVAEGLLFLHCGWEQRIIHRDIKAANVLLDNKFAARLGDFGLSKLMDDSITQQTMTRAGTMGYIAPELIYTGRASEKSDIYSFGILLLEVACGKSICELEGFLLDWVWEAHSKNALLTVADPKLGSVYDIEEMRVMLYLGLACSNPNAEMRPSIRRCCLILNNEAILPDLPDSKPALLFTNSRLKSSGSSSLFSASTGQSSGVSELPLLASQPNLLAKGSVTHLT